MKSSRQFVGYSQKAIAEINERSLQESRAKIKANCIQIAGNMVASGKYSKELAASLMNINVAEITTNH